MTTGARGHWTLAALRFFFGAAIVGVLPAINTLLKAQTWPEFVSRVSGLNFSHQTLGLFACSLPAATWPRTSGRLGLLDGRGRAFRERLPVPAFFPKG